MDTISDRVDMLFRLEPAYDELEREDYNMISARVMHERFYRTVVCCAETNETTDQIRVGRLYEAAKTMVYSMSILAPYYRFKEISIAIDPNNNYASISATAVNSVVAKINAYYTAEDEPAYSVYLQAHKYPGDEIFQLCRYPVHHAMILAYDVNFPLPSQFVSDVQSMIVQLVNDDRI